MSTAVEGGAIARQLMHELGARRQALIDSRTLIQNLMGPGAGGPMAPEERKRPPDRKGQRPIRTSGVRVAPEAMLRATEKRKGR